MMQGKIYKLIDPITLKIRYIGQTMLKLEVRQYQHWRDRVQKKNQNNHKANWINKLWIDHSVKPIIELVEEVEESELNEREKYWIDYYINLEFDLTNTSGENYYRVYNKKHRTTGKIIYCYDKEYNLRLFNTARVATNEIGICYKVISAIANGKKYDLDYTFSFEELSNQEIDNKFKLDIKRVPIIAINIEDGSRLEFKSQTEAAKQLNCNFRNVNQCLKGIRNSCAGYKWYYKDEI